MSENPLKCPFKVPAFDAGDTPPKLRCVWWSWHPDAPVWTRTGWEGVTEAEAWQVLNSVWVSSTIKSYHNKLIREGDGAFTEVADLPCGRMDVWHIIAEQKKPEHAGLLVKNGE